MVKLARYLKPFIAMIIGSIVLLFIQAVCDLNLPNYMSDIVNVGLQQGGITSPVPEAVTEKTLATLLPMMPQENVQALTDSYTKVEAGDTAYTKKYPVAETENILVLKDTPAANIEDVWIDAVGLGYYLSQGNDLPTAQTLFQNTDPDMLRQFGIVAVKNFYGQLGMDTAAIQNRYILKTGLIMLLITLIGAAASILVGYLSAKAAAGFSRDIRHDVFERVEGFSSREFDHFSTSSLITRTTNDITQVQMLVVMAIRMFAYAPIMGVGGTVMAIRKGPSISWIIALAVILLIGLIAVVFAIALPKFRINQKLIDRLNLVARENLTGIMAVRAFGNQKFEAERFDKANQDLTQLNLFISRLMALMFPVMMLIMNLCTLLIVWVGSNKVADSVMQVGDMMAFMQYAMQIIMAFLMISMMFIMVPRASVSGGRLAEVLEMEPSIVDPEKAEAFNSSKKGIVEFDHVHFRYQGAEEDVLENISFTAHPGETTAFIGSTGSGKSTLINLIPRFYDVTSGQVRVSGVDVCQVSQGALHDSIGYVPQKGVLHSGTIASNLRYGKPDASDEDIQAAAEVAQAMEFISKPDVGFENSIAQGGTNVSGGQKQRLSIARALVKKPQIYIFDDSFSALDFKTDKALRKALKEYTGDSTVLIVAQRVSTIMHAEQIIVLDEGKIVGKGTHAELLKNCPTYYEIASSQLSKEELQ